MPAPRHPHQDFADHCAELLRPIGPVLARRMFGGWGYSVDGLTLAIIADLGQGPRLWLKSKPEDQAFWFAAGCERFCYRAGGEAKGMNYFTAPEESLESPEAMLPWAKRAWDAALAARKPPKAKSAKPAKPPRGR